ncbi:uncharacterized protein H6S33_003706 [Morchella sextelata]|uniref:uncharacterized protein n=1 Tax=Morchella sextelata TaxID=1174677 RepID=UPI001D0501D3|nr:uncharacterized protein H6S33_003706 [Morchella sextelata]KAH0606872.1 hypothetical protein H6S33_003706 [Morchella sextelata]
MPAPTQAPVKEFKSLLEDTFPDDTSLPPFMEPLIELPSEFAALEDILQQLPIKKKDGTPGLLAQGRLGDVVNQSFPNLIDAVEKYKDNQVVLNALYRDYSFLASAYLLEPCHHKYLKDGDYGLARDVLPKCFQPFMEYAGSYALFNYRLLNPDEGLNYDNIAIIRAFEHGLDRTSSEAGFILVHVDMVQHSGGLIDGAVKAIRACQGEGNHEAFRDGLKQVLATLRKINATMEKMWGKSKPGDYNSFRTFIFGIASQSMFPKGVIYESVSDKPLSFRGESGANDSMVPLCDNLLEISMPDTPLTEILKDFRKYRPGNHRDFLEWVKESAAAVGIQDFSLRDPQSAALYLLCIDQVRDFRWRHWCFTREYILKKTNHPTATGGSPIWLPNQLKAVLALEVKVIEKLAEMNHVTKEVEHVREIVERQTLSLEKEERKYCEERKQ